ncbi:MAG: hypothetical protein VB108_06260, partial [Anaerolineaceae bacterium]|nr:hypothetical protein [Anaerolineaceae bacterium]
DELQTDLDVWMKGYNLERTHSGKYCFGRTPYQTFLETKAIAQNKMVDSLFVKEEGETQDSDILYTNQLVR